MPVLVGYAKMYPAKLKQIGLLLKHMTIHFQNETAGQALVDLIEPAAPKMKFDLIDLFVAAGRELGRRKNTERAIRDLFTRTAERFRGKTGWQGQLATQLEHLVWDKELSGQEVADYLDRKPDQLDRTHIVRNCGQKGFEVINVYARDTKREKWVRLRAIHLAIDLKAKYLSDRVRELLWDLYQAADDDKQEVKAAALSGVRQKDRPLSDDERRRLYADYLTAAPDLKQVFDEGREWYFGPTILGSPSDQ